MKIKINKIWLSMAAICMCFAAFAQKAPLKIGWAMESIDPGKNSIMPGYGYFRPSQGIIDPIYATALVLDNGKESVIFDDNIAIVRFRQDRQKQNNRNRTAEVSS